MINPIPSYVDEMVDGAVSRLNNLKNDNTFSFAFITDTHNCTLLTKRSLYAIEKINKQHPILFNCIGGDYLCNNANTPKSVAIAQHGEFYNCLKEYSEIPETMVLKGNHDDNSFGSAEIVISRDELYDVLFHCNSNFTRDESDPKALYGYYDIPSEKLRVIFLDSTDVPYYTDESGTVTKTSPIGFAYGNKQLNWFAHKALCLPEKDWSIIVFAHIMPIPSELVQDRSFGGEALWEILCAFKNGTQYHASEKKADMEYHVDCDFEKQGKGDIIAFICGHNHADRTCMMDGIRTISTLSAASDNFGVELSSDGTFHYKTRGSGEESAFTVFVVDKKARRISAIRCGAGPDYGVNY